MSFYTSLTGLRNAQIDLGVISHNIANAETAGFKKSRTNFADIVSVSVLTDPALTQGIGSRAASIKQEFSLGPIEQTGNALDLAVNGDGLFTTMSPISGRTQFTRAGSFSIDGTGNIVNASGNRLQLLPVNASGAITSTTTTIDAVAPQTNAAGSEFAGVAVSDDGQLLASYADGSNTVIGVVALSSFVALDGLKQLGSSNWEATGLSGAPVLGQPSTGKFGSLLSGAVERSNVDIAEELVGLITAQRYFQANAKAIDTATQISQTIINLRN
ncbi:MAG: flagellar hook-basal body complex protein [Novosphingobium sp.]